MKRCREDGSLVVGAVSVARRKLFDVVMSFFLLGNTNARALFTRQEGQALAKNMSSPVKLLYLGVGDVRNVLTTLNNLPLPGRGFKVEVVLNDSSALTLARDVLLLELATKSAAVATAVWSDALLSEDSMTQLGKSLERLVTNPPCWLAEMDPSTRKGLVGHWQAWKQECDCDRSQTSLQVRREALLEKSSRFIGHGRAGASQYWRQVGVSSVSKAVASTFSRCNPTLFVVSHGEPHLVEFQGPMGAFHQLEGLCQGGTALAQILHNCWRPLFAGFTQRVESSCCTVRAVLGDCTTLLESGRLGSGFTAIDTSNLMDYVGLWNLLLLAEERLSLREGSFIFTEQIMGLSTDIESMLHEQSPFSPCLARTFARVLGTCVEALPSQLGPGESEKVVHARWVRRYTDARVDPASLGEHLDAEELRDTKAALGELERVFAPRGDEGAAVLKRFKKDLLRLTSQELGELAPMLEDWLSSEDSIDLIAGFLSECLSEVPPPAKQQQQQQSGDPAKRFFSALFQWIHGVLVPHPFAPEVIQDPKKAVDNSQPMPFGTSATCAKLVARIGTHQEGGKEGKNALRHFFHDPHWWDVDHVRLRLFGLCVQACLYGVDFALPPQLEQALPALLQGAPWPKHALGVFSATFSIDQDAMAPRAGLLEPALACVFCKSNKQARALMKRSRKWVTDPSTGKPINLAFEYMEQAVMDDLQIIGNLQFDALTSAVSLVLPAPSRIAQQFKCCVLIDVQQYRVISEPLATDAFVASGQEDRGGEGKRQRGGDD